MGEIRQRIAYLQGLAEGLGVNDGSREGQVISGLLDVLDEMAGELADVQQSQDELEEYLVDLDESVSDLEDDVYQPEAGHRDGWWEITCPDCGTVLEVDNQAFDDEEHLDLICPNCGNLIHDRDDELQPDEDTEVFQP